MNVAQHFEGWGSGRALRSPVGTAERDPQDIQPSLRDWSLRSPAFPALEVLGYTHPVPTGRKAHTLTGCTVETRGMKLLPVPMPDYLVERYGGEAKAAVRISQAAVMELLRVGELTSGEAAEVLN